MDGDQGEVEVKGEAEGYEMCRRVCLECEELVQMNNSITWSKISDIHVSGVTGLAIGFDAEMRRSSGA